MFTTCSQYTEITLTDKERLNIAEGLSDIKYDPNGNDNYICDVRISAYRFFPERVLKIFEKEKASCNPSPCIVINNLPIDDKISGSPSFEETGLSYKSGTLSENTIIAVSLLLGEPYSVKFEGLELVNNIVPHKNHLDKYTGLGSKAELDLHIENSALKFIFDDDCSPSGVLLLGLRQDPNASVNTYFSDACLALKLLDSETLKILKSPLFNVKLPYRWREIMKRTMTAKVPLISGPDHSPRIHAAFYPDMVHIDDKEARAAFDKFYYALKKVSVGIDIKPGQLVYVNNRFSLHARGSFDPTYDENGLGYRWLQRTFITQDLWAMRDFRLTGRIYDPGLTMIKSIVDLEEPLTVS